MWLHADSSHTLSGQGLPISPNQITMISVWEKLDLCEVVLGDNCEPRTAVRSYLAITTGPLVTIVEVHHLRHHCCYQGAFQEVNILTNRAHLVNVKFILTESSYEKNYFLKTVKVISNLLNVLGKSFPGQTYVQK
jgi:hypothetical protein